LSDDFLVDNMRMFEGEERENYVAEWIHHEVHRDVYRDVEDREKFAHDFRASAMAEADSRDREEAEEQTNAALEARNEQLNNLRQQQSFVFAGGNDWSCKRCGDIFSSMRLLGFHRCDFTRQTDQTETEAEVYNFRQLSAPSENDWKCQRCGEIFSSMTSISTHTCDFTQNVNVNQNVLINIQTGTGNTQTGEAEEEKEKWETEYNVDVPDLDGTGSDPEAVGAANPSPDRNLTTSTPDRADRDTTQLQNENENFQPRPRRFRLLQKHLRLSQAWKDRKEKENYYHQ
jgi:rubrerythrin